MEELTAEQIRVLGCLVEKQLTTPQAYPLTESALITACNQSTNRDPVVRYEQGTVRRALLDLRQLGLAKMVHRPGDRVEKHRHLLDEALSLTPAQVAVLAVLMLRGPQTVGELRTRGDRLHPFQDLAQVEGVLAELSQRQPEPLVRRLERLPGQSQARFRHLLGDLDQEPAPAPPAAAPRSGAAPDFTALRDEIGALRERVERLEARLGD